MAAADPGRPWWASAEDTDAVDDADPLAAHRAARDGDPGGVADDGAPPWWAEVTELVGRLARDAGRAAAGYAAASREPGGRDAPPGGAGHAHPDGAEACRSCPVCAGIRTLTEARPEVVEHLTEAARHVTLAARALLDAQAEALRRDDDLQRVHLDEE